MFICPQCGYSSEVGGVCVKTCGCNLVELKDLREVWLCRNGFFLRDDTEMRKKWEDVINGQTPAEAYSFCKISDNKYPFQRLQIFAGPKNWAIEEACKLLEGGVELATWTEIREKQKVLRDLNYGK